MNGEGLWEFPGSSPNGDKKVPIKFLFYLFNYFSGWGLVYIPGGRLVLLSEDSSSMS